jgi:hypothetical protein
VGGGQPQQLVFVVEAEGPELRGEVGRERGLRTARGRHGAREAGGALPLNERHHGGGEQQRRQAIGVDPPRQRQELGIIAQRREERRGQRP